MIKIEIPPPGSDEALLAGCECPVLDNAHGLGYMGGDAKDDEGNVIYVINWNCELHGVSYSEELCLD